MTIPVRILQCTFPAVHSATGRAPISQLCLDYPLLSLMGARGLLLCKVARVLWVYRCDVRMRSAVPYHSAFMRVLHSDVAKWLEMPSLSLGYEAVHMFLCGIHGWSADRNVPFVPGSEVDGSKRPPSSLPDNKLYMFSLPKGDKVGRKRYRAEL